jgi:hypothetical protein
VGEPAREDQDVTDAHLQSSKLFGLTDQAHMPRRWTLDASGRNCRPRP